LVSGGEGVSSFWAIRLPGRIRVTNNKIMIAMLGFSIFFIGVRLLSLVIYNSKNFKCQGIKGI
jgi:hypothetical protein